MAIAQEVSFESIDNLLLDSKNPRLGRENTRKNLSQEQVLKLMQDWTVEELAESFIQNGQYWIQEPLLVVREIILKKEAFVVIEGNRRLAALKLLQAAKNGSPLNATWKGFARELSTTVATRLFSKIPYLLADSRDDIVSFLGFRHVTGIKEWEPAEKAEFVARMIDEGGRTYQEVMRLIGSKTETVRRQYIAFRVLIQMEEHLSERISVNNVQNKFSVLFLSLRSSHVQKFLGVDITAEPDKARNPVPRTKFGNLVNFSRWLFGDDSTPPLVTDSRKTDKFATILSSPEAVSYLITSMSPQFDAAYRIAGGTERELAELLEASADAIEQALGVIHHHKNSRQIQSAVRRVCTDAIELIHKFPAIERDLLKVK